jgi:hypothetical protein
MSQLCAAPKCERTSRVLCDCCKKNLCLQHLNEHNALLVSQLNPLTDELNALGNRLQSFNICEAVSFARQELEQWRKDCHEKIDDFFEQKCQEIDCLATSELNEQRDRFLHVQSKINKFIRQQEATRHDIEILTSDICQLEREMKKLEKTTFQVNTHSLVLDDSFIQVKKIDEHEFDLSSVAHVYRTLPPVPGSYATLTSNNQVLLIHQKPNLCLVNREMNVEKQIFWPYKSILDMCWSASLGQFVIIDEKGIFLVDDRTMAIKNIEKTEERSWLSCMCSEASSLFLSTNEWGSSIVEMSLSPTVATIKEWKSPSTCSKDERIDGMAYRSGTSAIVIKNRIEKLVRMELRSCETMDRIWSLPLNIMSSQNIPFRCCSLSYAEWLMINHEDKHLMHITKDGKLKTITVYNGIPWDAILFGSDMLAISTNEGINFHKI